MELQQLTLDMTHLLRAARPIVFAAFTDPGELAKWWGPEGFTTPDLDYRAEVGGRYRIAMQPPDGDLFHLTGEFCEVNPPTRLAYTFVWDPPDPDDVETLVSLSLRETGQSTEVDLSQGPFRTEARRGLHRDGWTESFARLEQFLATPG